MIDFKTIPPNTCIYCESEGEWNELCDKLESSGYHWGDGDIWESNERPRYAAEDSWSPCDCVYIAGYDVTKCLLHESLDFATNYDKDHPAIVNYADLAQSQMQISIDSISSFL